MTDNILYSASLNKTDASCFNNWKPYAKQPLSNSGPNCTSNLNNCTLESCRIAEMLSSAVLKLISIKLLTAQSSQALFRRLDFAEFGTFQHGKCLRMWTLTRWCDSRVRNVPWTRVWVSFTLHLCVWQALLSEATYMYCTVQAQCASLSTRVVLGNQVYDLWFNTLLYELSWCVEITTRFSESRFDSG